MTTPLDRAYALMQSGHEADALTFYRTLADAELFLLLEHEFDGTTLLPKVFDLETGPMLLAFDLEDRLAAFADAAQPYAVLPGRVIARHIAGQAVALGLNLGSDAPCETILPPDGVDWLLTLLDQTPATAFAAQIAALKPPNVPQDVTDQLTLVLTEVDRAFLFEVRYQNGTPAQVLALIGVAAEAEAKYARAVTEVLAFSGLDAAAIDLLFLPQDHPFLARLGGIALGLERVQPQTPVPTPGPAPQTGPGLDPDRPPRLR